mgnify:CR=1 FL=1
MNSCLPLPRIVVGILRTRPPGMTLDKMPIYLWAMLIVGAMIYPAVIFSVAGAAILILLVFVIHATVVSYHWLAFGASHATTKLSIAVYLGAGGILIAILAAAVFLT